MSLAYVCYNADVGLSHAGERAYFSEMVHAHFNNADLILLAESEKSLRHARLIVEIALRFVNAELAGECSGDHFFCGSLSGAACYTDDLSADISGVTFCEILKRGESVVHENVRIWHRPVSQGHNSAVFHGVWNKFAPVETLSYDRDEERAVCFSAVYRNCGDHGIVAVEFSFHPLRRLRRCKAFHVFIYLYFSKERFIILSHSSLYPRPMAAAACGTRLVGVMPGRVLTSRQ